MRTSEALVSLHERLYGEIGPDQQKKIEQDTKGIFFMVAQAPNMMKDELTRLTFETPANVLREYQENPEQAHKNLLAHIAAARAWERIGIIEDASPSEEEIEKLLPHIEDSIRKILEGKKQGE